jgi:predicted solute-binding protein
MTTETPNTPKQAKGGTFAPADVDLIKKLIMAYVTDSSMTLSKQEEQQAINLLHRLGRIS